MEIMEPTKAAAFTQAEATIFNKYHLPAIPEKYMSKKTFFQQAVDAIKNFGKTEEEIAAAEAAEAATAEAAEQEEAQEEATDTEETATEPSQEAQEAETSTEEGEESTEEAEGQEAEENDENSETKEEEEEAEDTAQTENAQLKETIQQLNSRIEALTSQLNDVQSKLSRATAKSTKPRGVIGKEDDDSENVNVPFMAEVKALDENFMLGKPLANPKPRKDNKPE